MANTLQAPEAAATLSRALNSLTATEVTRISLALIEIAPEWTIERHESCDGILSVVLLHCTDDLAFVIDRNAAGFAIGSLQDDDWKACIHQFDGLNDLLSALTLIIAARSFFQDKREAGAEPARHDMEAALS